MQPISLVGKNVYRLGPTTAGVTLHAISSRGMTFIPFQFSKEELQRALEGKPMWAVFRGSHIPEMTCIVGEQSEIVPRHVHLDMLSSDSDDKLRQEAVERFRKIDRATKITLGMLYSVLAIIGILIALALMRRFSLFG